MLYIDPRQYIMTTTDELLARLVNLETENRAGTTETELSGTRVGSGPTTYPPVNHRRRCDQHVSRSIDTRTLGKQKSFTGQTAEWTTWQFTFKAFAAHPKMKEVFDLAARKGSDPVVNSDMTAELQSLSTQLYYMLVMMLSDQALEIVRNSPEGNGAEVWRKLLWEYELGVGIRYKSILQSLLKRRLFFFFFFVSGAQNLICC